MVATKLLVLFIFLALERRAELLYGHHQQVHLKPLNHINNLSFNPLLGLLVPVLIPSSKAGECVDLQILCWLTSHHPSFTTVCAAWGRQGLHFHNI